MKLWPLGLYRVAGDSMAPTYRPGDVLLGWRWGAAQANQIVVANVGRPIIKRVARIDPDGYWLEGDNAAASTDSRNFGAVSRIEAVIIAKIASGQ